jgi:hypothetical protein
MAGKRITTTAEDNAFGCEFLEQVLEYVSDNFEPEDVFDVAILEQWAKDNGYASID